MLFIDRKGMTSVWSNVRGRWTITLFWHPRDWRRPRVVKLETGWWTVRCGPALVGRISWRSPEWERVRRTP